jgi:hypothetical protein
MKLSNSIKPIGCTFAALIISGMLCSVASAAKPSILRPPGAPGLGPVVESVKMSFKEIEFDQDPMFEVVDFLRDNMSDENVNFVLSDEIADVEVNVRLRNVSFSQLTKAIEMASGGRVQIEAVETGLYHVRPGEVASVRTQPILRVFNLSKYLSGKADQEAARAIEDLMDTVEMAFDMLNDAKRSAIGSRSAKSKKPLDSKFHPGTKLMLVIGSPADVEVFHEVTSQLLGQPRNSSRSSSGMGMGMGGGMSGGLGRLRGMDDMMDAGGGMDGGYDEDSGGGLFKRRSSGTSKMGMDRGASR